MLSETLNYKNYINYILLKCHDIYVKTKTSCSLYVTYLQAFEVGTYTEDKVSSRVVVKEKGDVSSEVYIRDKSLLEKCNVMRISQ